MKNHRFVSLLFSLLFVLSWAATETVFAETIPTKSPNSALDKLLAPYVKHGTVLVANDEQILYRYSSAKQALLPPASVLKILVASAALRRLGSQYQYRTRFYLNAKNDLIIEGSGDPFLVSEEWTQIAQKLKEQGISTVRDIILDTRFFASNIQIPGLEETLNPYDARNGALVANFNTINVRVLKNHQIISAEEQTPLTPLAKKLAKGLSVGRHRINFSQDPQMILAYVGELFQVFLEKKGIHVQGKWHKGSLKKTDRLIYTHKNSKKLQEVIAGMMLYSNNFIANQLMLTLGVQEFGTPATLEKGVKALSSFLEKEMKISAEQFHLVEGSGISRKNRIAPEVLIALLRSFYPYRHLLPQKEGLWVKTGTLKGVYALQGYLPRPNSPKPLYFVIMLQQKRNTRDTIFAQLIRYGAKL